jgi:hypothetical protein
MYNPEQIQYGVREPNSQVGNSASIRTVDSRNLERQVLIVFTLIAIQFLSKDFPFRSGSSVLSKIPRKNLIRRTSVRPRLSMRNSEIQPHIGCYRTQEAS